MKVSSGLHIRRKGPGFGKIRKNPRRRLYASDGMTPKQEMETLIGPLLLVHDGKPTLAFKGSRLDYTQFMEFKGVTESGAVKLTEGSRNYIIKPKLYSGELSLWLDYAVLDLKDNYTGQLGRKPERATPIVGTAESKIAELCRTLTELEFEQMAREFPALTRNREDWEKQYGVRYVVGRKYININFGGSGKYMVDKESGNIYGIKAYGQVHLGHFKGNIDSVRPSDLVRGY